jgi:OOP family OmpA-OmpF porin
MLGQSGILGLSKDPEGWMTKLFFLLLALGCVDIAEARDRNGQVSIGAGAGPAIEAPWATREFRQAVGIGPRATLFGRYHYQSNYAGLEFSLDYFKMSQRTFWSRSGSVLLFWRFQPEARVHPVTAFGVGFAQAHGYFDSGDMDTALFTLRAGLEYELDADSDLAFHLDHLTIFKNQPTEPNTHVIAPTVKYIRYFGSAPPPVTAGVAANASADKDTDGDGVADSRDNCPGTDRGVSVNELGCAKKQSFEVKLDVKFRSGTAELVGATDTEFAQLAKILADNDDLRVEIQGHTDSSGGKALNQRLSQARAEVVRERLIREHQVDGARLTAKGYGASQPVDTNNNPAGRANNRRVTAMVIR